VDGTGLAMEGATLTVKGVGLDEHAEAGVGVVDDGHVAGNRELAVVKVADEPARLGALESIRGANEDGLPGLVRAHVGLRPLEVGDDAAAGVGCVLGEVVPSTVHELVGRVAAAPLVP
jgi:hypothetical protein